MKDTKAVCLEQHLNDYFNKNNPAKQSSETIGKSTVNIGCPHNSTRDNVICTCRRIKKRETGYFSTRQVYRSQRYYTTRDFTDIGVGSVKTLYKKRVTRIYLPQTEERGVGSSILSVLHKKARKSWAGSYYDQKKTSSKCVGGAMDQTNVFVISKNLSPIIQTKSCSTSPTLTDIKNYNNTSSFENIQEDRKCQDPEVYVTPQLPKCSLEHNKTGLAAVPIKNKTKSTLISTIDDSKNYSSDSFVQHIYNLENPSYDKSKTSVDLIENRLEREYRKIFSTNSNERKPVEKPVTELKSSMLRKRFAGLRKLGKKEENVEPVIVKISSKNSIPSRKDVSIASDPPSLEARSFSHTKLYNPSQSITNAYKQNKPKKDVITDSSANVIDNDYHDVRGMFKLWGKKFNLDEENYNKNSPIHSVASKKQKKKVEIVVPKDETLVKGKKERKRFSFFRRKSKDKSKIFKSKKGVTAGRCEVGDGLMIKVGAANEYITEEPVNQIENIHEYDILRKAWFRRFLYNTIDSQNSVKIRWNNNMYAASSSTVFELMDSVYKNTGIVYKSRSHVTTGDSSYYSYITPRVNFMPQNIETWMIPTITDGQMTSKNKNKIEVTYSNQKWLIEKSKAFSQNIELVLHSNIQNKSKSSEYIIIDIPKGYFSETSSEGKMDPMSDELVYNIVEYEILNSKSHFLNIDRNDKTETGDAKNIHLTISVKDNHKNESKIFEKVIKNPPVHRDVVIQGSDVYFPRRRDVIEVGIITQRDMRDMKKPILKIQNDHDNESRTILPPPKTCELAESFLQDYYRNCSPLGFDIFNWCISESKLRGSSENNSLKSLNNQGDAPKSCPNMVEDYQASTVVTSCETSSCSHCVAVEEKKGDSKGFRFFNKFAKKSSNNPGLSSDEKRVLPKDSLEVFKKRKLYAASNKSKWVDHYDKCEPYLVPSIEDKGAQKTLIQFPKLKDSYGNQATSSKKTNKKHVSLQDCDVMNNILKEQLSDKVIEGILSFKGASSGDSCRSKNSLFRRIQANPDPIPCEIPQPLCKKICVKKKEPPCSKKYSPSCNVPNVLPCPAGSPAPYQKKHCPPSSPPCRLEPSCFKSSGSILCPYSPPKISSTACSKKCSSSTGLKIPSSNPKSIPPQIHSPQPSTKTCRSCIRSKTQSITNIPESQVSKKLSSSSPPLKSPANLKTTSSPSKLEKTSCRDFPWLIKNQLFNTPSKESGSSSKISPQPNLKKYSSNCIDGFKRLIQKVSGSNVKEKECKPDCANVSKKPKVSPPRSPHAHTNVPVTPPCKNDPKMTGLQLKKAPMPRNISQKPILDERIIRLNSKEKITVKLRQSTPSTEEIREGCNIKVEDEDGRTLYERKDYRKSDKNRTKFVRDMYKESQIQRIATTNPDNTDLQDNHLKATENISNTSLSNIIEINFNLKFKQGDKTTEVCIENCGDIAKDDKELEKDSRRESSKEIYVLNEKRKQSEEGNKDVNIKIMIKNIQIPNVEFKKTKNLSAICITDEFSKKISEKFNTVCTGSSDVIDKQAYSIHRTTISLTNSAANKVLCKSSVELLAEELKNPESVNLTESEQVLNEYCSKEPNSNTENLNEEDSDQFILLAESKSQIYLSKYNTETTNDEKSATSVSVTDNDILSDSNYIDTNNVIPKIRNKEEKKKMLKEIFEISSREKNKDKIRQMLQAVLASESSGYDIEVQNKQLTDDSLKSDYFNKTDSITKIIHNELSGQSIRNEFEQLIYPTEENNSECTESDVNENLGCICSQLAGKLKLSTNNSRSCCCGRIDKKDEEVTCDLRNPLEYFNKIKLTDAELQSSTVDSKVESVTQNTNEKKGKEDPYTFSSKFKIKACQIKKLNRCTVLGISDDDEVVLLSSEGRSKTKKVEPVDVLQLYETKKAVLEIYTEKTVSDNGERCVAKLPKFVYDRESEIRKYQEIVVGYKSKYIV